MHLNCMRPGSFLFFPILNLPRVPSWGWLQWLMARWWAKFIVSGNGRQHFFVSTTDTPGLYFTDRTGALTQTCLWSSFLIQGRQRSLIMKRLKRFVFKKKKRKRKKEEEEEGRERRRGKQRKENYHLMVRKQLSLKVAGCFFLPLSS